MVTSPLFFHCICSRILFWEDWVWRAVLILRNKSNKRLAFFTNDTTEMALKPFAKERSNMLQEGIWFRAMLRSLWLEPTDQRESLKLPVRQGASKNPGTTYQKVPKKCLKSA